MKKPTAYIACIALLLILAAPPAWSIGMGVRRKEVPAPTLLPVQRPVPIIKFASPVNLLVNRLVGMNIIMDTAVAKNRLFNYRLNLDCDTYTAHRGYLVREASYTVNRLSWSNTFGFGLVRSRHVRLWAGPQVTVSYEFSNKEKQVIDSFIYSKVGTVIGANIHTSESTTICIELGFRAGFGFDLKKSVYRTFTVSKPEPVGAIRLIFRAWDFYVPSEV